MVGAYDILWLLYEPQSFRASFHLPVRAMLMCPNPAWLWNSPTPKLMDFPTNAIRLAGICPAFCRILTRSMTLLIWSTPLPGLEPGCLKSARLTISGLAFGVVWRTVVVTCCGSFISILAMFIVPWPQGNVFDCFGYWLYWHKVAAVASYLLKTH